MSDADPCLFHCLNHLGQIIMVIHVDDCYVIGHKKALLLLVKELSHTGLKVKVSVNALDYLSCNIKIDMVNHQAWIGQTTLLNKVIKRFGPTLNKLGNYQYKTPGTPGQIIIRPTQDQEGLTPSEQATYRSGVGTLLQFANKTRPDLANPVRELSKGMDQATPAALKEMYRILKYLIQTKDLGLKISPNFTDQSLNQWTMRVFSDRIGHQTKKIVKVLLVLLLCFKTHLSFGNPNLNGLLRFRVPKPNIMQHPKQSRKSNLFYKF
jgi:hypothetical protein